MAYLLQVSIQATSLHLIGFQTVQMVVAWHCRTDRPSQKMQYNPSGLVLSSVTDLLPKLPQTPRCDNWDGGSASPHAGSLKQPQPQ